MCPHRLHQEKAGHGKAKGDDDIVDIPEKEHRKHPVQHKKELYPRIDPQSIAQGGYQGIQQEVGNARKFVSLIMVGNKRNRTNDGRTTRRRPDNRVKMVFWEKPYQRYEDTRRQAQDIHYIKDPQLPSFVTPQGRSVPNIPDITPQAKKIFYSLVHGQSLRFSFDGYKRVQIY